MPSVLLATRRRAKRAPSEMLDRAAARRSAKSGFATARFAVRACFAAARRGAKFGFASARFAPSEMLDRVAAGGVA